MEDSSNRDLKKRLCILEDENGIELSLGLSCGGGGLSSSTDAHPVATEQGSTNDDERIPRLQGTNTNQGSWLDSRRKPELNAVLQPGGGMQVRQFFGPELAAQQQVPWGQQGNKQVDPASKLGQFPVSEITKYLAGGKNSPGIGHPPVIPSHATQNHVEAIPDDDEPDSSEQQKKFSQHQEARKKRKMLIDEHKLQKKNKDDEKPEESAGLGPLHRVSSLSAFQNRAGLDPAMAALASQFNVRRTTSEPTLSQALLKDDPSNANVTKDISQEVSEAARAVENGSSEEAKHLLGMWQLGTTSDVPSAESINPELTSMRPGSFPGQIGGNGSSPDLPWVSATGPGGKTISGVAYKLFQGQFKVVCSCHGLHMSPSEFVKHAGNLESSVNGKALGGDAVSMLSQVTSA